MCDVHKECILEYFNCILSMNIETTLQTLMSHCTLFCMQERVPVWMSPQVSRDVPDTQSCIMHTLLPVSRVWTRAGCLLARWSPEQLPALGCESDVAACTERERERERTNERLRHDRTNRRWYGVTQRICYTCNWTLSTPSNVDKQALVHILAGRHSVFYSKVSP